MNMTPCFVGGVLRIRQGSKFSINRVPLLTSGSACPQWGPVKERGSGAYLFCLFRCEGSSIKASIDKSRPVPCQLQRLFHLSLDWHKQGKFQHRMQLQECFID